MSSHEVSLLAQTVYGDQNKHPELREKISDELIRITNDSRIRNILDTGLDHLSDISDSRMRHLVYQLVTHLIPSVKSRQQQHLTNSDALRTYATNMRSPALPNESVTSRYSKYGGEITFAAFSCIYDKNVWVLQPALAAQKYSEFKWHLVNASSKRSYEENKTQQSYITLFYIPDGLKNLCSHYDVIISREESPPPCDDFYYELSGEQVRAVTQAEPIQID